jgi:hypothetical protein
MSAVTRPEVDLQLRHAIRQVSVLTRIPVDQALHPNQNLCSPCTILQHVEPISIDVGLLNTHAVSVARGLRFVKIGAPLVSELRRRVTAWRI